MLKSKFLWALILFAFSTGSWASGMGWSMFPMLSDKKLLSTEFVGDFSSGGGVGFQVRYTQRLNSKMTAEGGIGYTSGERAGKIFLGFDYEIFPDYNKQPRISVKAYYQNAKEYNQRTNRISVAPMISKGFNFWGKEGFPYLAIPLGVNLNSADSTWGGFSNLSLGITGKVPWERFENLLAQVEGQFNLANSYSGVFIGLSFPLN